LESDVEDWMMENSQFSILYSLFSRYFPTFDPANTG
jgi:hypothetical protein